MYKSNFKKPGGAEDRLRIRLELKVYSKIILFLNSNPAEMFALQRKSHKKEDFILM